MIQVQDLTHRFGNRTVLKHVDLDVREGEIVAIMGSSGGGKTTLLRCIAGLLTPSSGQVTVDGIEVRKRPEEARRRMGMVFQQAALFDSLNVEDNVLFGVRRHERLSRPELATRLRELLERIGLSGSEKQMPAELSGGMRKRVGIARALAERPKVLLYDEPTTGLDPITTYTIDRLIVDLRDTLGVTSLIVSHDVSSVLRVADRVAFLESGSLTFVGTPEAFASAENEAIRELIEKSSARSLE